MFKETTNSRIHHFYQNALHSNCDLTFTTLAFVTRAFQRKRPSWNFGFNNNLINTHVRRFYWWAMADGVEVMRWRISTNTVDVYKTDTKCAHSVHGRPTLKDEERFWNGLVRKPYKRSLYERTFMSEHFIEKHAISTELCNINREKHKLSLIVYVDAIVNQAEYQ